MNPPSDGVIVFVIGTLGFFVFIVLLLQGINRKIAGKRGNP